MNQYRILSSISAAFALITLMGCTPNTPQEIAQTQQSQPHVTWNGDVDDSATVFVQVGKTWVDDVKGKPVENATSNFQGILPSSDGTTVTLASKAGRGDVEIVQQPTKDNNYTAGVRIMDPEAGKDHYKFVLTW